MEIKSHNVLIGSFVLTTLLAIVIFAMWIAQIQLDRQYTYYHIVFEGSVSGLGKSGAVQYNGLPVGKVADLYLAEDDPNKVIALVQLDSRTPVKEDSVAKLELYGLTGVALIEITGGSPNAPMLKPKPGETYATITAAQSTLQELAASAPEAMQEARETLAQIKMLVSENQQSIHDTLANIKELTGALAASSDDIEKTMKNLSQASVQVNSLTSDANKLMKNDVRGFLDDASATARSFRELSDQLETISRENGPALGDGISELPGLVSDMRALVSSLDKIASKAQDDPARFLLGNNVPEVEAK
ncbi:MAG: MCE family protein [Rhizobiales bacterium]|nr:MCE family protein [Hyphomicrobiales bacterium]